MNILTLDTETSPNAVDTWGLFNQTIGITQIRKPGSLLCFAAKWLDRPRDEVIFDSINQSTPRHVARHLHSLYSDADIIIGYNSIAFDTKVVNKEFLMHGLPPPAPFKQIDLLKTMRQRFRFASNKLDFVTQQMKIGAKTHHQGHGLWTLCEAGDQEAWALMEKYNRQDVVLTEDLYLKLRPWVVGHPNLNNFADTQTPACSSCGSADLQSRGFARTLTQTYRRYQCKGCGTWTKEGFGLRRPADLRQIMRAA